MQGLLEQKRCLQSAWSMVSVPKPVSDGDVSKADISGALSEVPASVGSSGHHMGAPAVSNALWYPMDVPAISSASKHHVGTSVRSNILMHLVGA